MNIVIFLLFAALSFGELVKIHIGEISFGLIDILVIPALILGVKNLRGKKPVLLKPILLVIAAFSVSLLVNLTRYEFNQALVALLYLVRWIAYSSVYFMFLSFVKGEREKVYRFMFISGFTFLALGFLQYFYYPNLRNLYYLGWDEHMYRLFGPFLDPNFAGIFISLFFFFSLLLGKNVTGESRILSILTKVSIPLSLIGVILTYSRSALIVLLGGFFLYCLLKKNFKLLLGAVIISTLVILVLSKNFYIENTNLFRTASSKQRLETVSQGIEIYKKSPIFGVGFNTLRYARDNAGFEDLSKSGLSHSGAGVDNSLVFVLVTSGIVGVTAYLYLLYSVVALAVRNISRPEGVLLLISILGLTASSLFINSLFYSFLMIWVWSLVAVTERT